MWLLSTQFTKRVQAWLQEEHNVSLKGKAVLGEWIRTAVMHICLPSSPLDSTLTRQAEAGGLVCDSARPVLASV